MHIIPFQRHLVLECQQTSIGHLQADTSVGIYRTEDQVSGGLRQQQILSGTCRQQPPADSNGKRFILCSNTPDIAACVQDQIASGGQHRAGRINRIGDMAIGREAGIPTYVQAIQHQIAHSLEVRVPAHATGQRLGRLDEQRRSALDPDGLDRTIPDLLIRQVCEVLLAQLPPVTTDDEHVARRIGQRKRQRLVVIQVAAEQVLVGNIKIRRQATNIIPGVEADIPPDDRRLGLGYGTTGRPQGVGVD